MQQQLLDLIAGMYPTSNPPLFPSPLLPPHKAAPPACSPTTLHNICYSATLLPCHPATLPPCHPATMPPCHAATLPRCHPILLPLPLQHSSGVASRYSPIPTCASSESAFPHLLSFRCRRYTLKGDFHAITFYFGPIPLVSLEQRCCNGMYPFTLLLIFLFLLLLFLFSSIL